MPALYRDEVVRLSLRAIRARFPPRVWAAFRAVRVEHEGIVADVELVKVDAVGLPSGWRSAMRCPRCGKCAEVLGCVPPGFDVSPGWGCARCARWRGRPRNYRTEQIRPPSTTPPLRTNSSHRTSRLLGIPQPGKQDETR